MSALQITARKKQKNHAPTYCPSVTGLKAFEKIWTAVCCVLNIIPPIIIPEVPVAMVIPDVVEDMPAMEDELIVIEDMLDMDIDVTVRLLTRANPRQKNLGRFSPESWETLVRCGDGGLRFKST